MNKQTSFTAYLLLTLLQVFKQATAGIKYLCEVSRIIIYIFILKSRSGTECKNKTKRNQQHRNTVICEFDYNFMRLQWGK